MQYRKNELSNSLKNELSGMGLILFCVVERVICAPSLKHYGKFEEKMSRFAI